MTSKTRKEKNDRFGYVELIHEKSDSLNVFKAFKAKVELQLGKPIKAVKSDRDIQCQTLLNRMGLQKGGIPYNPHQRNLILKPLVVSLLAIALDQGFVSREIPFREEHVVIPFPTSHVPNMDVPIVQQPATNQGEHGDQVESTFLGCKWVFKTKRDSSGKIERYKARLVVKGYSQREGIDFKETFSPVSTKDSFRVIMAIVAHFDLELHQMDVKTAFLNGDLDEEVYMEQPIGFVEVGKEDLVCKLNKSIYGLKQLRGVVSEV
ncbi:hypothetical protein AAG906_023072 [Vitis piasezkii]